MPDFDLSTLLSCNYGTTNFQVETLAVGSMSAMLTYLRGVVLQEAGGGGAPTTGTITVLGNVGVKSTMQSTVRRRVAMRSSLPGRTGRREHIMASIKTSLTLPLRRGRSRCSTWQTAPFRRSWRAHAASR
jgi:hypothetical protein